MALRLAVDFGTATTCMATVPNVLDFQARVLPIEDVAPIARTAVFLDRPHDTSPLVRSKSTVGRSPLAAFDDAYRQFDHYWSARRDARTCGIKWAAWEHGMPSREEGLLLTYFKPELADHPVRVPIRVPQVRLGRFDPMAQYQETDIEFEERSAAMPDPDTEDLVSGTAAVIRRCVQRALESAGPGERLSHLTIGLPSFGSDVTTEEADRARTRRLEAVTLAGIADDFGTDDFRVELYGEAEAAAWSVDLDLDRPVVYKIIVDVGAGTTDLALVEYHRERGGRYRVERRVRSETLRYAGRDLTLALSLVLRTNPEFLRGTTALDQVDKRAWQYVMDHEIEKVKCGLTVDPTVFSIDFSRASAHEDATDSMARIAHHLRCSAFVRLAANDPAIRNVVGAAAAKSWLPTVSEFIAKALEEPGVRNNFAGVEKVGGAFRFAPLHAQLLEALRRNHLAPTQVQFRDQKGEAQTMVARGLARWTALLP